MGANNTALIENWHVVDGTFYATIVRYQTFTELQKRIPKDESLGDAEFTTGPRSFKTRPK